MDGLRLRQKLFPLHRAVIQVVCWVGGITMWLVGAHDAPPLGVTAQWAWVPFVALALLNVTWHNETPADGAESTA